ncbi:hypothetical protein UJ101_02105 [Flavobacteriaceae bacterium UJ101]|nr:hypothetical protein UJ101_02105 [Flavobacteriaceae bacterium UJ101]
MSKKHKTYFNWSTGKDSSLALYYLLQNDQFDVKQLLTSINVHYKRVSMHGVRYELVMEQAQSIGIPLTTLELPQKPDMETYDAIMYDTIKKLKLQHYTHTAFGDIFLEDLRSYRENQLKKLDIEAHFPLWKKDTTLLMREFINLGFKAKVICINSHLLDLSFLGRDLDESFIQDLPKNVDPCGENGEFHTFCYDGPIFTKPISFTIGEKTYKEYTSSNKDENSDTKNVGFWFCDLLSKK